MRSSLFRLLAFCTVLGVALVGLSVPMFKGFTGDTTTVREVHASGIPTPVGKWNLLVTFTSTGEQEPSLMEFSSSVYSPYWGRVVCYTPFYGTGFWYMTDSQHFKYEFLETIYDPSGTLMGYVWVQQSAALGPDGTIYDARGQGTFIPRHGSQSPPNPTTTHAARM